MCVCVCVLSHCYFVPLSHFHPLIERKKGKGGERKGHRFCHGDDVEMSKSLQTSRVDML